MERTLEQMQGTPSQLNPSMPGINIRMMIIIESADAMAETEETSAPREKKRACKPYLKTWKFEKYGSADRRDGCRRLACYAIETTYRNMPWKN